MLNRLQIQSQMNLAIPLNQPCTAGLDLNQHGTVNFLADLYGMVIDDGDPALRSDQG